MFCGNCGKMIQEGNKFCIGCGEKVEPISIKVPQEKVEIKSEIKKENTQKNMKKDKPSVLYNILAFFVPLAGLVIYLITKKDTPKLAKYVGISALIGYILSTLVSILYCIFIFWFTFNNTQIRLYNNDYIDSKPYYENYNKYDYNI